MTDLHCTRYTEACDDGWRPCSCPVCGGFLKWNDGKPTCKKCGADLMIIPEKDEETGEEMEWGKICPIGLPKPKEQRTEELRTKRLCKTEAKKWKGWL